MKVVPSGLKELSLARRDSACPSPYRLFFQPLTREPVFLRPWIKVKPNEVVLALRPCLDWSVMMTIWPGSYGVPGTQAGRPGFRIRSYALRRFGYGPPVLVSPVPLEPAMILEMPPTTFSTV